MNKKGRPEVNPEKIKAVDDLAKLMNSYDVVGVLNLHKTPASVLQIIPNWITAPIVLLLFSEVDSAFIYISWAVVAVLNAYPNSLSFVLITQKRDSSIKTLLSRLKFTYLFITILAVPLFP